MLANARSIAKESGFGTTGVDNLMASIGLTGGAVYGHFPSKEALFAELVEHEILNSAEMLAGDRDSPPDHVAKRLRSYLSSYHALHPETGCVLPALGPEIARAGPEVRAAVEEGFKRLQKNWRSRIGDPDAAWALIPQCWRTGSVSRRRIGAHPQRNPGLQAPLHRPDARIGRDPGEALQGILTAGDWLRSLNVD